MSTEISIDSALSYLNQENKDLKERVKFLEEDNYAHDREVRALRQEVEAIKASIRGDDS